MAIRDNDLNLRGTDRGSVAGLFSDYSKAQQAIADLKAAGFSDDQIGVARADQGDIGSSDMSMSSGTSSGEHLGQHHDRGMWDKIKNAFGGGDDYDRDRSAIRDDVTNSTGAAYSDENADFAYGEDFPHHLSSAGLNENESRYFAEHLHGGGCLVTVNTSGGRAADAIAILERNGADIGSGAVDFGTQRKGQAAETDLTGMGERRIQLLGEMLRVHKERVARGEVRLRKEVVTENKNIQVPVTREELVIERTNVSGDVPANAQIGENKEIRVPLSEEQVRVEKQPVVTGEVRVGKRQVTDTKNVSDTVRREEVKVDREGDVDVDDKGLGNKDRKVA